MKKLALLLCCVMGLLTGKKVEAFVMIGPMHPAFVASGGVDFNYTDDLGGPKELKNFFRWNIPMLTYAFDASFMQYFGLEGRDAVNEAFTAVNDFFANDDYDGVSALELTSHGFRSNYNTTWINQTAQNAQIIDVKSLTLGLLVNQLGLGNPHRYAFGNHAMTTNTVGTQINFNVRLRNFDPITEKPTSYINNVNYSYRLVHDAPPSAGVTTMPSFADMEEFTTDTSGNAWTAVSGIADSFYGNTAIFWTDQPSLFGFGVYYDGLNAMGGQYKPRHALTYDDAGGLKYLYRTNNFVYEGLDPNVALILPANFLPTFAIPVFPNGSARVYPDPTGLSGAYIPRRNAGLIPGLPINSILPAQAPPALIDVALRGGIDKIQFQEQPFDSFLGITFTATNHTWTDTFVSTNGQTVLGLDNTTPGASTFIGVPQLSFFTQELGRGIFQPDIIFVVDELGVSPDGVPIGFNRTDNALWIDNYTNNLGPVQLMTTNVGPGTIIGPMQYTFTKLGEGFEVIWSGEASVVGNTNTYSLWGHIKGPGPSDVVIFPNDAQIAILENALAPTVTVPNIARVIDSGGDRELNRTQESLIIEGSLLSSATAIQIMNGDVELQTINDSSVQTFIRSNQRIEIPPGILNEQSEGAASTRTVRVWNTLGPSTASADTIGISTGLPVITGTSRDKLTYNRAETLNIFGYGFKSGQAYAVDGNATLTHFRVEDATGNMVFPVTGNSEEVTFDIKSDTRVVLPLNAISSAIADGSNRFIRVARGPGTDELSSTNNLQLIANITTKPVISSLTSLDGSGNFRRDEAITINGTALNTAYRIEIINSDGSSLSPAMTVDLPVAGVAVDDNGSRIQISADVFFTTQADGYGTADLRKFKVFNAVGNTDSAITFNVNAQPTALFVAGFTSPNTFNRDVTTGDDVTIAGTNLKAITEIQLVDENGIALTNTPKITLPNPGVTVTDNSIVIDTSVAQFSSGSDADSSSTSLYRLFSLSGSRDTVRTPQNLRFYVGVPPTYTSYAGLTSTSNYRRDSDIMTVNGTAFDILTSVEIVDVFGNSLANNSAIGPTTGVTVVSGTQFTVAANSFFSGNLLDSSRADSRRLKIVTPFGSIVSSNTSSGAFTVSATPTFPGNSAGTFAGGGGFDGGANTYTLSNGNLMINGNNFLGVKTITLEDNAGTPVVFHTLDVNPFSPPVGITFNATGTQITITAAYLTANALDWADSSTIANRRVRLISAANQVALTPAIITAGAAEYLTIAASGGYAYPNYQRNGVLTINKVGTADFGTTGAPLVTSATLVDASGTAITGISPVAVAVVNGSQLTIAADAFDNDGKESDSITANRRLKLTYASTATLTSSQLFTVSSPPTFGTADVAYLSVTGAGSDGYVVANDEYDHDAVAGANGGNISISTVGQDANGIVSIDFWKTNGGAAVVTGTTQLLPADWTVDATGDTVTITKATISAKGLAWFTPDSTGDNRAFRLNMAYGSADTIISPLIEAQP